MEKQMNVLIAGAHIGSIAVSDRGELSFRYAGGYRGPDLSVAAPKASGAIMDDHKARTWFSGLLPDNEDVRQGMSKFTGGGRSTFALLSKYGMDLPGAVQVAFDDDLEKLPDDWSYVDVSREDIGERLARIMGLGPDGADGTWMNEHERWSLGGGQPKLALREVDGQFSECRGSAASNVIVKPGVRDQKFKHQSLCEGISMRLAKRIGLRCADVRMEKFGDVDAIVVNRYDRALAPDGSIMRLHQEDMCQAMSVFPDQKYPSEGGPDAGGIMRLLKESSEADDRMTFFDALVFNYLIAAPDAHGKNYALMHFSQGRFRLAPLYDVASMAPYMHARDAFDSGDKKRKTYRCAMSIGGENQIGRLRKSNIDRFAKLHDLSADALRRRIENIAAKVKANVEPAVNELSDWAGADEIGSLLVARVNALCDITVRNIFLTGNKVRYIDLGNVKG